MKRRLTTTVVLLGFFILLVRCSKYEKTSVGSDYFERENSGSVAQMLKIALRDTSYQTYTPTGYGTYLYVGQNKGLQTQILLLFASLPDSGVVDSVILSHSFTGIIGSAQGSLIPTVHTINGEWDETEVTWESFNMSNLLGNEVTTQVLYADTDSVSYMLPQDLVQSWMDTSISENYGLHLSYSIPDTGFIMQFYSKEAPLEWTSVPQLTIYVTRDSIQSIYTKYPTADAFIATVPYDPTSDRLYIADGAPLRSLLFFDMDSIPENATVNRALLTLYNDTTLSFPDHSSYFEFVAFICTDTTWWSSFETFAFDSSLSFAGSVQDDSAVINLTFYVQNWIIGVKENHGIILMGKNERSDLMRRAFYSRIDPQKKPRLEIIYSLPPSGRF